MFTMIWIEGGKERFKRFDNEVFMIEYIKRHNLNGNGGVLIFPPEANKLAYHPNYE